MTAFSEATRPTGWSQKTKPLPVYRQIVLNCIKACEWD